MLHTIGGNRRSYYLGWAVLALLATPIWAQAPTITRSIQLSGSPNGPIGFDNANNAFFPGYITALGYNCGTVLNNTPCAGGGGGGGPITATSLNITGSVTYTGASLNMAKMTNFNVMDAKYGIQCNGTTDDTANLQKLGNDIIANGGNANVIFPANATCLIYNLGQTVGPGANVSLWNFNFLNNIKFQGNGATIKVGYNFNPTSGVALPIINIVGASNIEVDGLNLSQNYPVNSPSTYPYGAVLVWGNGNQHLTYRNSLVMGAQAPLEVGGYAVMPNGTYQFSDGVLMENVTSFYSTYGAVFVDAPAPAAQNGHVFNACDTVQKNVTIRNLATTGIDRSIYLHGGRNMDISVQSKNETANDILMIMGNYNSCVENIRINDKTLARDPQASFTGSLASGVLTVTAMGNNSPPLIRGMQIALGADYIQNQTSPANCNQTPYQGVLPLTNCGGIGTYSVVGPDSFTSQSTTAASVGRSYTYLGTTPAFCTFPNGTGTTCPTGGVFRNIYINFALDMSNDIWNTQPILFQKQTTQQTLMTFENIVYTGSIDGVANSSAFSATFDFFVEADNVANNTTTTAVCPTAPCGWWGDHAQGIVVKDLYVTGGGASAGPFHVDWAPFGTNTNGMSTRNVQVPVPYTDNNNTNINAVWSRVGTFILNQQFQNMLTGYTNFIIGSTANYISGPTTFYSTAAFNAGFTGTAPIADTNNGAAFSITPTINSTAPAAANTMYGKLVLNYQNVSNSNTGQLIGTGAETYAGITGGATLYMTAAQYTQAGFYTQSSTTSSGTITNSVGQMIGVPLVGTITGTAAITNTYGMWIQNQGTIATGLTRANVTGLHIDAQTNGSASNWALDVAGYSHFTNAVNVFTALPTTNPGGASATPYVCISSTGQIYQKATCP